MGRSGTWFAFEHWGIEPDVVTLAKSFGGGLPLGAILSTKAIFDTFLDPPLSHLTTFGGNPVACAAAIAAFDVTERDGLVTQAAEMGEYLGMRLESVRSQFPSLVTAVRGRGLWYAFDLADPDATQPLVNELQRRGVLVGSVLNSSGTIRVTPPLVITPGEIDVFIGALRAALGHGVSTSP
jgi:acetylornithine/succinyldiaminopimelate/putrescine aminotransferase